MIPTRIGINTGPQVIEAHQGEFEQNKFWEYLHLPLSLELWCHYTAKGIGLVVPRNFSDISRDEDGDIPFDPFNNLPDYFATKEWLHTRRHSTSIDGAHYHGVKLYRPDTSSEPITTYTRFDDGFNNRGVSVGNALRTSIIKAVAYYGGITSEREWSKFDRIKRTEYSDLEDDKPREATFRASRNVL